MHWLSKSHGFFFKWREMFDFMLSLLDIPILHL